MSASFTPPVAPAPREVRRWTPAHTFFYTNPVTAVAFGPDLVVAGDEKGVMILWDAQTGKKLETLLDGTGDKKPIDRAQISPDGIWLYFVTHGGDGLHQCQIEKSGRAFIDLVDARGKIHGVSNDGGYWLLTHLETKILVQVKIDDDTFRGLGRYKHRSVVIRATGEGDAIISSTDDTVMRWDNGKDKLRWEKGLEGFSPTALALSYGGNVFALAGKSGGVRLYDAGTGKLDLTLTVHKGAVSAVAFSPDSKQLATGGADATTRIWDVVTGRELDALKGHTSAITAVAFSPGGEMLVTGSEDKTARVWVRK